MLQAWMCPAKRRRKSGRCYQALEVVFLNSLEQPLLKLNSPVIGPVVVPKCTQVVNGASRTHHQYPLFAQRTEGVTQTDKSVE